MIIAVTLLGSLNMLIECPNCFNRVIVSNGVCPSCQSNVNDSPRMAAIVVGPKTEFPPFCHRCNVPTNTHAKIVGHDNDHAPEESASRGDSMAMALKIASIPIVLFVSLIFGPFGFLFGLIISFAIFFLKASSKVRKPDQFHVTVSVPTCSTCKDLELSPLDASWEKCKMRIVVDREFARRM